MFAIMMLESKRVYFTRTKFYDCSFFFSSGKRILRKFAKAITKIKLEDLHKPVVNDIGCLQVAEVGAAVTSQNLVVVLH